MAIVSLEFAFLFGGDEALYVGLPTGFSTSALASIIGAAMAILRNFSSVAPQVFVKKDSEKK